jgi:hypothetical protein
MNYVNYDMQIVQRRHVKLIGWPANIMFIPPSILTSVDDVRLLLHVLRTKKCRWVQLSDDEVVEHMEDLQRRMDAGEVVGRKRKIRSDKGKKRKKLAIEHMQEEEQGQANQSASEAPKGGRQRIFTSREFVESSEDDTEGAE